MKRLDERMLNELQTVTTKMLKATTLDDLLDSADLFSFYYDKLTASNEKALKSVYLEDFHKCLYQATDEVKRALNVYDFIIRLYADKDDVYFCLSLEDNMQTLKALIAMVNNEHLVNIVTTSTEYSELMASRSSEYVKAEKIIFQQDNKLSDDEMNLLEKACETLENYLELAPNYEHPESIGYYEYDKYKYNAIVKDLNRLWQIVQAKKMVTKAKKYFRKFIYRKSALEKWLKDHKTIRPYEHTYRVYADVYIEYKRSGDKKRYKEEYIVHASSARMAMFITEEYIKETNTHILLELGLSAKRYAYIPKHTNFNESTKIAYVYK